MRQRVGFILNHSPELILEGVDISDSEVKNLRMWWGTGHIGKHRTHYSSGTVLMHMEFLGEMCNTQKGDAPATRSSEEIEMLARHGSHACNPSYSRGRDWED
jgi:hypothetical protein